MTKGIAFTALAVVAAAAFAAPGSAQSLDEVLEKHYEAIGGADAWAGLQTMKASGTLSVMGGMAQGPFSLVQKRPAMYRLDLTVQGMSIVQAYDGETAWQVNPMMGSSEPQVADPTTTEIIVENSDLDGPLIGWKEDGHQVALLGQEALGDNQVFKLEVTANGNTSYFYLDADTYELVQVESSTAGQSATTRMSDYRDIGGLMFPFAVDIDTPMGAQALIFDSVEINVDVDESQFSMAGLSSLRW